MNVLSCCGQATWRTKFNWMWREERKEGRGAKEWRRTNIGLAIQLWPMAAQNCAGQAGKLEIPTDTKVPLI